LSLIKPVSLLAILLLGIGCSRRADQARSLSQQSDSAKAVERPVDMVRPAAQSESLPPRDKPVEVVGNIAFHQIFCDDFDTLAIDLKQYTYHLWRAGIYMRDIAFADITMHGLEIRQIIDDLMTARRDSCSIFDEQLKWYAIRYWVSYGNHDLVTHRKFVPEFSADDLMLELEKIGYRSNKLTAARELLSFIFDPDFQPATTDSLWTGMLAGKINALDYFNHLERLKPQMELVLSELETALTYAPKKSKGELTSLIEFLRYYGYYQGVDGIRYLSVRVDNAVSLDWMNSVESDSSGGRNSAGMKLSIGRSHSILAAFGSLWLQLMEQSPDSIAYILPEPVPIRNRMGGITDVKLIYTGDFIGQMLRFDLME
jgi:hypothetical protein